MSDYEDMTVAELKDMLREQGLPVSGNKAALVERLRLAGDAPAVKDEEQAEPEEIETVEAETEEVESDEEDDEDFEDDYEDLDDDEDWDDEETIHIARQKPKLDDETKSALAFRNAQSKRQPAFRRQEWFRYRRLARTGWRKPRGKDSSMRKNRKYRPPMARVGFGKLASARGLHPSGFREVMVHKPDDLDDIDPNTEAARVGGTVGKRKRIIIHERADELGIRVLNRRRNI